MPLVLFSLPLRAEEVRRVALDFKDAPGSEEAGALPFKRQLAARLSRRADIVLIDARQLRRLGDARTAVGKGAPSTVTARDSDLLLRGEVEIKVEKNSWLPNLLRYRARGSVELVTTDTGQILAAYERVASAPPDSNALAPRARTLDLLAEAVEAGLAEHLDGSSRPRRFEVVLRADAPLRTVDLDRVLGDLRGLEGVRKAQVIRREKRSVQVDLYVAGTVDTEALAFDLSASSPRLVVESFSSRALQARWAGASAQFRVRVGRIAGPRDLGGVVRQAAEGTMDRLPFVRLVGNKEEPHAFLRGQVTATREGTVSIRVELDVRGRSAIGRTIVCARSSWEACTHRLAAELGTALEREYAAGKLATSPRAPEVLSWRLSPSAALFPSMAARYLERPVTELELRNRGRRPVEVRARATLDGFSRAPREGPAVTLAPGASAELPIFLDLEPGKLHLERAALARLSLVLDVGRGDARESRPVRLSLVVHDRHALAWDAGEGRAVAGFVDGRARGVAEYVERVTSAVRDLHDPLALPAALVEAASQIDYQPDALHPLRPGKLDEVRFPDETLGRGRGDCDDLSVLLASLAAGAGRDALFVLTPGHVSVGLELGLHADHFGRIALSPDDLLEYEGRLYLPIETTAMTAGLKSAWSEATKLLAQERAAGREPELFSVKEAWEKYPSARLKIGEAPPAPPISPDRVSAVLGAIREGQERWLETALGEVGSKPGSEALNLLGIVLAQRGRMDRATQLFRRAAVSGSATPVANLGALALTSMKAEQALRHLRRALQLRPGDARIQFDLALAHFAVGDEAAAMKRLAQIESEHLKPLFRRLEAGGLRAGARAPDDVVAAISRAIRPPREEGTLRASRASGQLGLSDVVVWLR